MDVWFHNEITYPFVPEDVLERADSVRASLPNKYCDPRVAAGLFEECLDEFMLCDDEGLNVVAIEHHAGINSLLGANPLLLGILARQTRRVRILSLGTLISLRPDPVRVAEEYATADVISRGRLEIGFVKSGGSEMASNNANPINNVERYWEAIDLVTKALTHQEGPFSWEGKHYTHRHVNIWPRPYQEPHPRMWAATGDPETAAEVGRRGMVNVLVLRGPEGTKQAWGAFAGRGRRPACRRSRPITSGMRGWSTSATRARRASGSGASSSGSSTRVSVGAPVRAVPSRRDAARSGADGVPLAAEARRPRLRTTARSRRDRVLQRGHAHRPGCRAGHEARDPLRGQSRHGLSADHGPPRRRRRLRAPDHGRPVGLPTHAEAEKNITLFAREVLPRLRRSRR